jgi:hypothetical protein
MPVKRAGNLSSLQPKLENAVKRGLILGGQVVAQRAQAKAHVVTGRMKRGITHSMPRPVGAMTWRVDIGGNVEYEREEEFREGTKDGTSHAHLRPALAESRDVVVELLRKNIGAAFR